MRPSTLGYHRAATGDAGQSDSVLASIPSPTSSGFHVGPFDVHIYGLMYIVALLAAVLITVRRWEAAGGSRELVYEVAIWAFPAGLIGGRVYFLATSWNEAPHHWWGPLAVWDGGLGIWGGIALGSVVGLWRLRRQGVSPGPFLDAAAPALLVGQALGRIGNYFNQELFGGPTSLPWGLQISSAHRPAGDAAFTTFHPTFLYELSWDLGLAAFLVWLGHRRRIRPPGLFALYVAGYSAFRIFEESLRVDPAHHILGLRLNLYVACALTVAGAVWFMASQRRGAPCGGVGSWRSPTALALGWTALALFGCGEAGSPPLEAGPPGSQHHRIQAERPPHPQPPYDVATRAQERSHQPAPKPKPKPKPEKRKSPKSMPPASAGTNGSFAPPPASERKTVTPRSITDVTDRPASQSAILLNGIALAPPNAPTPIQAAISAANTIADKPYVWGGGHGSWYSRGYDCSGAVSYALAGAGFLAAPLNSSQLESWGKAGPGRWLTVYANGTHAYAVIAGLRWDTVGDARGSGPRWHAALPYPKGFVVRHARGY